MQETLVRIVARLDQFEGRSRFLTWATSIAVRVAMIELRRRRWKEVPLDAVLAADEGVPANGSRSATSETHDERRSLIDALHRLIHEALTDKQRAAIVAELRGMPQDEIARHLGSNRNAVYKLTHDARRR